MKFMHYLAAILFGVLGFISSGIQATTPDIIAHATTPAFEANPRGGRRQGLDPPARKRTTRIWHDDNQRSSKCTGWDLTALITNEALPRLDDCQQLWYTLATFWGYWEVSDWNSGLDSGQLYDSIFSVGTCHFGIVRVDDGDTPVKIGVADVMSRVATAIYGFTNNGMVGAEGIMTCPGDKPAELHFVIYSGPPS